MKIDKVAGGHVPQTYLNQTSKKATGSVTKQAAVENQIHTSTAAIERAQAEMEQLPDVDMEKVEQIRTALSKGELALDTKALSKAVLKFHSGHE